MSGSRQAGEQHSVWGRLRRRKVAQWGVAYAIAAWGFLQVLEYLGETFSWPGQVRQMAVLTLLIGLPVALTIAWYHGEGGEQRIVRTELIIIVLLFVLGGSAIWFYAQRGSPVADTAPVREVSDKTEVADKRPSIAVLPFANRSSNPEDAFIVDGIHDDILVQLSRNRAMRVIARTSVEQFRDTLLTTREIGEKLDVSHVLEGGVQRAGDRIRVSMQLIEASTDTQLWAENYDREINTANLFAIQTEVGTVVANALRAELASPIAGGVSSLPTQSFEAWESYQLGRQNMEKRTLEGLLEAQQYFRRAIQQDPKFALAYAGLADATWLKADYAHEPMGPAMELAQEYADGALALDSNLVEAITTSAKLRAANGEFADAELLYRRALALNPNYIPAVRWYGQLLANLGRDNEALQAAQAAVALDPLWPLSRVSLASLLVGLGRFEEALTELRKANEIDPTLPQSYQQIGMILAYGYGQVGAAVPWFAKGVELDSLSHSRLVNVARLYFDLDDEANVEYWLGRAANVRSDISTPDDLSMMRLMYQGEHEQALELARQAFGNDADHPFPLWPLRLLRDHDLSEGQYERAKNRYASAFPELFSGDAAQVIWSNYQAAIDLCAVLQATGDTELVASLLDSSEALIRYTPRMGEWGYRIADVQIYALQGRTQLALESLREATVSGWRGPYWRYHRDLDPMLSAIRDDPEFKAIFLEIEQDMARQREQLAARPVDEPLDFNQLP